jgi:uncharacterized protein (TIGR03067 family)
LRRELALRYDPRTPSKEFVMRRTLPLLAGLLMGFTPAPVPHPQRPDAGQRELQAMQGAWIERFSGSAVVTIVGDRMVHTSDCAWKLTLYPKLNPRQIKAVGIGSEVAGQTRLGIYRLEGEKLIICWRREPAGKLDWPASLDPFHKDFWIKVYTRLKK